MANRYWVGGSGTWDTTATANWSASSGGAGGASAPTSADAVFIDANSGGGTVTLGENVSILSLTLTGFTGVLNWVNYKISLLGTAAQVFTGATTYSVAGTPVIDLAANATTSQRTVVSASIVEANAVSVLVSAGSDVVVISNRVKSIDFTGFSGTFTNSSRTLYGSLTLSPTMTLTAGANGTNFRGSTGAFTITSNGKTLDFPLNFDSGAGSYTLTDALDVAASRSVTFTSGTLRLKDGVTSTVGAFATSGTTQKFLQSTVAGTQATLSQSSGTVSASYLTIQDIGATGGATWNSLWSNNNVDAGNNTGWVFGDPPITLATEYTYALRSFTQPRRF